MSEFKMTDPIWRIVMTSQNQFKISLMVNIFKTEDKIMCIYLFERY